MHERWCRICHGWHSTERAWPQECIGHFGALLSTLGGRGNFPTPNVIRDTIDPLWHPADGNSYSSKSEFRAIARQHGLIEVGNEAQKDTRVYDEVTKDDVGRAAQMVNQGYKPAVANAEKTAEGWQ